MIINNFSPILFSTGPLEIRWYSLLFAFGIVIDYLLTRWLFKRRGWRVEDFDTAAIFLFLGMVIGARLGEVFFYHFDYYMSAPLEIFKVWKGGLASHGAAIGLLISYISFWAWKRRADARAGVKKELRFEFSKYADILVIGMPIVAGFVRVGNFFNSEILGRASDLPWAVVFAKNGETFARHPSQIYEALLAWGVFVVLFLLWRKREKLLKALGPLGVSKLSRKMTLQPYFFLFLFVALYFSSRFFVEFFKEFTGQEAVNAGWLGLTMGQWLSVAPVIIAVVWFGWKGLANFKKA